MAEISLEGMSPEAIQGLALLAKGLTEDPKTRTRMLSLAKERDPTLNIPEVDLPVQFTSLLEEERTKRQAIEDKMREDDIRREIREKRDTIMKKGISAAEVTEVEKLMTERGIVNHETAADFYLAQKKMAEPTPPPGSRYQPLQMPKIDAKAFGGNMRTWGKNQASEFLAQIRAGKEVV